MPTTAVLQSAGLDICEIKQILLLDREASREVQSRTEKLRRDVRNGQPLPEKAIETMETLNKDMVKELLHKIEKIESQKVLTTLDRELLQALDAQLGQCDQSAMRLTELRDLDEELRRNSRRDSGYPEAQSLGAMNSRRASKASPLYAPNEIARERDMRTNHTFSPPPPYMPSYNAGSSSTVLTPPSSQSPRSSDPSLERVDSQTKTRRSADYTRRPAFMPPGTPMNLNFPPPPTSPVSPRASISQSPRQSPSSPKRTRSMTPTHPASPHAPHVSTPSPRHHCYRHPLATSTGEYQYYAYADYDDSDDDIKYAEWSKTDWPLLYRILDINPSTDPDVLLLLAKRQLERLSLKHNPRLNPDDLDAPTRWRAINKAYDVLTHPERKHYYDSHGREPDEVEGIDLTALRIS